MDFVDAPPIQKQRQPTVTKEFLQSILDDESVKARNRVLIALLASTGMRVGELQALQIGQILATRTRFGIRERK